jgi:hypothetical protein
MRSAGISALQAAMLHQTAKATDLSINGKGSWDYRAKAMLPDTT